MYYRKDALNWVKEAPIPVTKKGRNVIVQELGSGFPD
jgi:hypothetical protein